MRIITVLLGFCGTMRKTGLNLLFISDLSKTPGFIGFTVYYAKNKMI